MSLLCDVMTNETLGSPFDRLVYLSNVSNPTTQDCNFQNYLISLNDSRIAASVGGNGESYCGITSLMYHNVLFTP